MRSLDRRWNWPDIWQLPPNEQPAQEALLAALRRTLGTAAFTAAWQSGRALSWERAVIEALHQS